MFRAVAKRDLGQVAEAQADYEKALEIDPTNSTAIDALKAFRKNDGAREEDDKDEEEAAVHPTDAALLKLIRALTLSGETVELGRRLVKQRRVVGPREVNETDGSPSSVLVATVLPLEAGRETSGSSGHSVTLHLKDRTAACTCVVGTAFKDCQHIGAAVEYFKSHPPSANGATQEFLLGTVCEDVDRPSLEARSKGDLCRMLSINKQSTTGRKAELVDRILDGMQNGALPRCPKCNGGVVRYCSETKSFVCKVRFPDRMEPCGYSTSNVERMPWVRI